MVFYSNCNRTAFKKRSGEVFEKTNVPEIRVSDVYVDSLQRIVIEDEEQDENPAKPLETEQLCNIQLVTVCDPIRGKCERVRFDIPQI